MVAPVNTRLFSTPVQKTEDVYDRSQYQAKDVYVDKEPHQRVLGGEESGFEIPDNVPLHLLDKGNLSGLVNHLLCKGEAVTKHLMRVECNGIPETVEVCDANPVYIPAETRIKEVIQDIRPSVVGLHMDGYQINPLTGEEQPVSWLGSGFVVDPQDLDLEGYEPNDGETLIATNFHVADGAEQMVMSLFDGQTFEGEVKVLVSDEEMDCAILVVDTGEEILDPVPIGSDMDIDQGEFVLAFGQPHGLPFRVTSGIINNSHFDEDGHIQTDAAINPGNSGGPLVDLSTGNVVGMNTYIYRGANNMGFAMPIWQQFDVLRENWEAENYRWETELWSS